MTPFRILATAILPSMLVGGLLFHSAAGQPAPPAPPAPPAAYAPVPPVPPVPPMPPAHSHVHVHVSGTASADQIRAMVQQQLAAARQQLDVPNLPPKMRAKLEAKLDKLQAKLDKRLAKLDTTDLDKMQEQLEQIGDEVSSDMEGFGDEMEEWGRQFGESMAKQVEDQVRGQMQVQMSGSGGTFHWSDNGDHGDDSGDTGDSGDSGDDHEVDAADAAQEAQQAQQAEQAAQDQARAASHLGNLGLRQEQRDKLAQIRADSERQVAQARQELARMSRDLRSHLADPNVDRDQVAREIEEISAKEAEMRKARILAWVDSRRVLDDGQRKRVQDAAHARH